MTYPFQLSQIRTFPMARPLSVWTFGDDSPRTREVAATDKKKLRRLCILPAYFEMEFIGPAHGVDNHNGSGESYWFRALSACGDLAQGTKVLVHANHCDAERSYSVQPKHAEWLDGWRAAMQALGHEV